MAEHNRNNDGGRPTKYQGKFCDMLLKHMGDEGLSFESFGGVVGVDRATLYAWEKRYKRFRDAKAKGLVLNLLFWERIGNAGMAGQLPGFNASAWNINMKNRHDWREKKDVELSGSVGVNLNGAIVALVEEFERAGSDPEDV
jgi:hypothetical protein